MVIYALLGTSRPLSVSTTTTISILTAADLEKAVPNGEPGQLMTAAATLAVLVGGMLMAAVAAVVDEVLSAQPPLGADATFVGNAVFLAVTNRPNGGQSMIGGGAHLNVPLDVAPGAIAASPPSGHGTEHLSLSEPAARRCSD